uniref:hypothetical protein n=1 Tax=Carnobacterium sp. TaxID=48221 RepID=UPI00344BC01C
MSSVKSIQAKIGQMEKLKQEIEETKNSINSVVGETIIKELKLDYEDLSSKKEINRIVKMIKKNLPHDSFKNQESNSVESNHEEIQKNDQQQPNHHSNSNRNF